MIFIIIILLLILGVLIFIIFNTQSKYSISISDKDTIISSLKIENENLKLQNKEYAIKLEFANEKILEINEEKNSISEELKLNFKEIANNIIKEKEQSFNIASESILKPLREDIQNFKAKIESSSIEDGKDRARLITQIDLLLQHSAKISDETNNLANALRSDSKMQGDWGEMILQNILESSGLRLNEEYFLQETIGSLNGKSFDEDDSNWKNLRPDAIIKYPNNKYIIVDSKVSIRAFVDYNSTNDKNEKDVYLKNHIEAIKNHYKSLSEKNYSLYFDSSPDFVFMFIPNDAAYSLAISNDRNLWYDAYKKKVVIINASNLITALLMIKDVWSREKQINNVNEIIKRATALYDKYAVFVEKFNVVGAKMNDAISNYDSAKKTLVDGKGSLYMQIEELKKLGALNVKKNIDIK